jgi:hypothetical protein
MPHDSLSIELLVNRIIKALFASLLLSSAALAADDAALLRCRAIADVAARLACYDALPLAGSEAKSGAKGEGKSEAKSGQGGAAQRDAAPSPEMFGLEEQIAPSLKIETIESSIPGHFEGWLPNEKIPLANGQVWQVADGSSRFYSVDNPKVTIRRGALGAFYLNLSGDNRTVRVRRIQ